MIPETKQVPAPENKDDDKAAADEQDLEDRYVLSAIKGSALMTLQEKSQASLYSAPLKTSWRPPKIYRMMTPREKEKVREMYKINIDGEDVVAPIKTFKDMRFPKSIIDLLLEKKIAKPTAIQMQALPVVLSGRDLIAVSSTGSGKSLIFLLPILSYALEEELKMPLIGGEGPFGIVILPSHELAIQIYELFSEYAEKAAKGGLPRLRVMLCIGGIEIKDQLDKVRNGGGLTVTLTRGVHIVIATPGRLSDLLSKKKFNLSLCRFLALDEADRLLDAAFADELGNILDNYTSQRQTIIFSSTIPKKIQGFLKSALIKPVVVTVGRAGSASLDVFQEIEYVKEENKLPQLLVTLQKTRPPTLIFCENKNDVDDIQEYLLAKGVFACGLHGGKSQAERSEAIEDFRSGKKDVMVATDVAAKGLDFPETKHVINFDMPKEIENYVHRIGRTGRCGRTGRATTYVNKATDSGVLFDLKHLLLEAGQPIPPFLAVLRDPGEVKGECTFCGGLGHTITNCAKLENQKTKAFTAANVPVIQF